MNAVSLYFDDEQTAKAVGKALQYLIRECGGKPAKKDTTAIFEQDDGVKTPRQNVLGGETNKPDRKTAKQTLEAQILKTERDIEKTQETIRKYADDIQRFDAEYRRCEQGWTDAETKVQKSLAAAGMIQIGYKKGEVETNKATSERYLTELRDNLLRQRQALLQFRD